MGFFFCNTIYRSFKKQKSTSYDALHIVLVDFSCNVPLPMDKTKHIIRKCTDADFDLPDDKPV